MTDAPDLLPCPFCGLSNATAQTDSETFHNQYLGMVRCLGCDATGPLPDNSHETPEDAIFAAVSKWNTRARPMKVAEAARLLLAELDVIGPVNAQAKIAVHTWLSNRALS